MDGFLKQEQVFLLKTAGAWSRAGFAVWKPWAGKTLRSARYSPDYPKRKRNACFHCLQTWTRELGLLLDAKDSAQRIITLRLAEFQQALLKRGQSNQLFERKA